MGPEALRTDGFAPIGGYAVIGDGRSLALVAADGSVDWWAVPAMDAPPVFAALLDPETGGSFALTPAVPYRAERRYLPGTNVLETTFTTDAGQVRVTDAVNRDVTGLLAWPELAREVRALSGEVPMRWRVTPGTRFRRSRPWTERRDQTPLLRTGDQSIAVVTDEAGEPRPGRGEISGEFAARPGRDALLALAGADGSPLAVPSPADVRARLRVTGDAWRDWCRTVSYAGPSPDLVVRAALTLKLLTYAPTGALMAAGTTSLPESIGGERNFDYRYGWVRDTSFALEALIKLGLRHEIRGTLAWMLDAIGRHGAEVRPFYGIRGDLPDERREVALRGYRDSRPVAEGNEAVSQSQWGCYGDLLQSVWLAVDQASVILDPATARLLEDIAGQACDSWSHPDSGIWELGPARHYTISKMACWAALDRMIRLAERGQVAARDIGRWRAEAAAIRAWTDEHCWSSAKRSYTFYAGSDDLDAAVLLAGRTGYLAGADPRFAQTIDAVRRELADGAAVYRYTGSRKQEGAFLACSFWLVDALARTGRHEQASDVWDGITALAPNDLGLMSEELDPGTGGLLGNLPQALSHLALISAAVRLAGD